MTDTQTTDALLHELLARQQIYDALMRAVRGVDRLDRDLILSAYHPGARDNHGSFDGPVEEFVEWVMGRHGDGRIPSCTHVVGNVSIRVEGDVAHTESYCIAMYRLELDGTPHDMFSLGRYIDRFERRQGEWKIAERFVVFDKDRLDPVGRTWDGPLTKALPSGRRDKQDPSYRFLP
jgi:hypothetical protein